MTKRVKIKTDKQSKVVLDKGLAELFFGVDKKSSFPVMYVYCDLVESQILDNDVQAPLLRSSMWKEMTVKLKMLIIQDPFIYQ